MAFIKGIPLQVVINRLRQDPEFEEAYEQAEDTLAMSDLLYKMRTDAGLSVEELAQKINVQAEQIEAAEVGELELMDALSLVGAVARQLHQRIVMQPISASADADSSFVIKADRPFVVK